MINVLLVLFIVAMGVAIIWLVRDIKAEIAGMKQEEGTEEVWEDNHMTNEYKTDCDECGSISADRATEFSAPQLQKCGDIWANSAKRIEL